MLEKQNPLRRVNHGLLRIAIGSRPAKHNCMKTILIIEDNEDIRENLAEILELAGYRTLMAENGKVGIQMALKDEPDLILCDVMMPELDGFGVLRILDAKPQTADIPFIFLTAKADKADLRRGMNLGADDYITKPFEDVELLDAISMRLKKSERIKTAFDGTQTGFHNFINLAKGKEALLKLSDEQEHRHLQKKDILYREGQLPRYLYFVVSGQVKVHQTNEFGKELITSMHTAGQFFGHEAILTDQAYIDHATAMDTAEVALIPSNVFLELLYSNRDFSAHFIKILADNSIQQEQELLSLAYNSIRKRVANALMKLYDQSDEPELRISRDDLASIVGTAKESAIRTLSDFKQEGLIVIEKNQIMLLDPERLANLPG